MKRVPARAAFLVSLLAVGCMFYVLNYLTPLFADDYLYCFSYETGERITALGQILPSQIAHYKTINGRFLLHVLAQLFLFLGKDVFNVANVFVFLAFAVTITYLGLGETPAKRPAFFLLTVCLLFLQLPSFGQSFLWLDGACNHYYGPFLALLALLPYRKAALSTEASGGLGLLRALGALLLGALSGATIEHMAGALILMQLGYMLWFKLSGRKIPLWMVAGLLGAVLGCVTLLLSPARSSTGNSSIFGMIVSAGYITCRLLAEFGLVLLLLLALLLYLLLSEKRSLRDALRFPLTAISLLGFLAASYASILAPYFPERAMTGPLAMLIITLLSFYSECRDSFRLKVPAAVTAAVTAVAVCISLGAYGTAVFRLSEVLDEHEYRVALIEEAKARGEDEVEIPSIKSDNRYSCFKYNGYMGDLYAEADTWLNEPMARYYGIGRIYKNDNLSADYVGGLEKLED